MKEPGLQTIYDPASAPIKGLASRRNSVMLPPGSGFFKELSNFRWGETGVLTVRNGSAALAAAIDSGKTVWGGASVPVDGVPGQLFLGLKDTSLGTHKTTLRKSADGASWTLLTVDGTGSAAAHKYGDNRLAAEAVTQFDTPISVAVVYDRKSDQDVVVFGNGISFPMVYDPVTGFVAPHKEITPPAVDSACQAFFTWENPVTIRDSGEWAWANDTTDAAWNATTAGTSPHSYYGVLEIGAAGGAGRYDGAVDLSITTAKDWTGSRQLIIIARFTKPIGIEHFLSNAIISVRASGGGAANEVVYDSATASQAQVAVVPFGDEGDRYVLGFSLDQITAATLADVKYINFSFNSNTADAGSAYDIAISVVAGSGQVPGGSSYEISYYHSGSRSESYSQVLPSITPSLRQVGAPTHTALTGLKLPFSADLYYTVQISARNHSTIARTGVVDKLLLYRRELGESEAYYVSEVTLATYDPAGDAGAGAWSISSGSVNSLRTDITDNTASEDRLLWLYAPGAFHTCLPICSTLLNANQRLIGGAQVASSSGPAYSKLVISRPGFPFRFTTAGVIFTDPETAVEESLPGESVQAFVASSASLIGSSSIFVFTDESIWLLNTDAIGTRGLLSRVASVGTSSPLSIAENDGTIYFLDSDLRVRRLSGNGFEVLSLGLVDDKLSGIPVSRRRYVTGAWFDFRFHLGYTPSGGTVNTRKLVWSEMAQAWESDDLLPSPSSAGLTELLITWRPGDSTVNGGYGIVGEARMLAIGSNTIPYRLENGTTDLSADIAVTLTTGDYHNRLWQGLTIRRIGVVGESQSAKTLNTKRIFKPTGVEGTSSILLTNSNSYTRKWDGTITSSDSTKELNGVAGAVELTGNLIGGKAILAIVAEVEKRDLAAAV